MAKLFDLETDGLWPQVSKVWMMSVIDTDTEERTQYSDYDPNLPDLHLGLDMLYKERVFVNHNLIGYDLLVLDYLFNWKPHPDTVLWDTWVMSQTLRFRRSHRHSLEGWGSKLGFPKLEFNDWTKYSPEMLTYGIRDTDLNLKVYQELIKEFKSTHKINPLITRGLRVEMGFAAIEAEIRMGGWTFDHCEAERLLEEMHSRMLEIESIVNPQIGMVCVKVDSAKEFKKTLIKKNGDYAASTARYFDIDPSRGNTDRPIDGDYCRIAYEPGRLSSDKVLKTWLYSLGWEPDEWNVERINGNFVQKSPKLTETSLAPLGEVGLLISEYNSISNRHGILKGWIKEAEYDGRLHGRMWTIGTPTFRCRHEVIANLPTVDVKYGKEMRGLLLPSPGKVLVGADSSGNQMRGLCHYVGNDEFTHEVINGDIHARNAETLAEFMDPSLDAHARRKKAKPFLYAFLFGGGAGKLALILTGRRDAALGKKAIAKFESSIKGLSEIKAELEKQYNRTKDRFGEENAFIRGIDGRIIFCEGKHKLLNYLLQTLEGITCKAAAVYLKEKLLEEKIEHRFLIHYHDEMAVECSPEDSKRVAELSVEAFTEAPKWFGVECMSGAAQIGNNYAEVH